MKTKNENTAPKFTKLHSQARGRIRKDYTRQLQELTDPQKRRAPHWFTKSELSTAQKKQGKELIEYGRKRLKIHLARKLEELAETIERVANAGPLQEGTLIIQWTRSRTWGATAKAEIQDGTFRRLKGETASGCGYCKGSTAAASALNLSNEVLHVLFKAYNAGREMPYGTRGGYGLPSFSDGVGLNCFRSTFEALGYSWEQRSGTGNYSDDFITIRKKR